MIRPVENIDSIKRRMIKNASKIWGFPDEQDINAFDPVLGLLIGALAEELTAVSNEINDADNRLLEKLLDALFTSNMFTHFPAHAIAFARPVQPMVDINGYYQFCFSKEAQKSVGGISGDDRKNIWFTPLDDTRLFSGEVKYLYAGKYLYEMDGKMKEPVAEKERQVPEASSKVFIAVRFDPHIELFDGFSLYFSFRNQSGSDRFLHSLQNATWKINGKSIPFVSGFENNSSGSLKELLKLNSELSARVCKFVRDFYRKRFFTIPSGNYRTNDFRRNGKGLEYLEESFRNQKLKLFEDDLFWIEADLNRQPSPEDINDLMISLNCFPVINRELNESTSSLVKGPNVIPLLTDDLFFEIARVSNSRNQEYHPLNSFNSERESGRSYVIRQGGIARFDSRDARKTLEHLIDLIRDEAAAFAMKGAELISFELKQLDQILARLQQRIDMSGITSDLISYLIIHSETDYERMNVQFWSVAGEQANNIRPGARLMTYRGTDLDDRSITLMTQTVGGKHSLSNDEKLNMLRRSLLSKGRIVTSEDIRVLCFELFGTGLTRVEVKKGVMFEDKPGKGYTRTLDVCLQLNRDDGLSEEDIWYKTESLKVRLEQESLNLLPYRILIES